jgi:hypothetical protein
VRVQLVIKITFTAVTLLPTGANAQDPKQAIREKTTEWPCRYGRDGTVQKTPVAAPAPQAQSEPQGKKKRGGGAVKNNIGQSGADQVQVMVLTLDQAAKALRQVAVNNYLDDQKDPVTLQVDFAAPPAGPSYAAATTLTAAATKIQVVTRDLNYQKIEQ